MITITHTQKKKYLTFVRLDTILQTIFLGWNLNLPSGPVTNSSQIIEVHDHPSSSIAIDNSGILSCINEYKHPINLCNKF